MAAEWKKRLVNAYAKHIKEYPVIGIVNLHGMPAAQLSQMRGKIRNSGIIIFGGRKNLFMRAIELTKAQRQGVEKLEQYLGGLPALVFSKENPFSLCRKLNRSKISAPAKPGDIAPKDIVIQPGSTPFAPGPIISELAACRIKTKIEGGKINISEPATVVRKGEAINPKLASILLRLNVTPMEIGLDMVAAYENGLVYHKDVLTIDEVKFQANLETAARYAVNLSVYAGILTKETTDTIISKAFREAKAVAIEAGVLADAVRDEVLAKAERQMLALKEKTKL